MAQPFPHNSLPSNSYTLSRTVSWLQQTHNIMSALNNINLSQLIEATAAIVSEDNCNIENEKVLKHQSHINLPIIIMNNLLYRLTNIYSLIKIALDPENKNEEIELFIEYINNLIKNVHTDAILHQNKQNIDRNYRKEILQLTSRRQSHPVAFSFFKDKGENAGQGYVAIDGKWLKMARSEKEPYLRKSLQFEQSSQLKNIDLCSQIREVKHRYQQQLMAITPPTAPSYRCNFTLIDDILDATEDKLFFLNDCLDHFYSEQNSTTSLAQQILSHQNQHDKFTLDLATLIKLDGQITAKIRSLNNKIRVANIILEASKLFKNCIQTDGVL